MPLFNGLNALSLPEDSLSLLQPSLSGLILGTAPDGKVGEIRYFNDPASVLTAFGGNPIVRLGISPTDTSFTLPSDFTPDIDPLQSISRIYDFSGEDGRPQEYPFLENLTCTQTIPSILNFSPIGFDASVQPASGGLFLEGQCLFDPESRTSYDAGTGLLSADLRVPLYSSLLEIPSIDYRLAGYRVGLSWLAPRPAGTTLVIHGNNSSVSGSVDFSVLGIGDGTESDRYLGCSVSLHSNSLILDPGTVGLPARRQVYAYADYETWGALLGQIVLDGFSGISPLTVTSQPTDPLFLNASPASFFTGSETPSTQNVSYPSPPGTSPDLTTAAAWADLLEYETPDFEGFGFVILSGLTGKALTDDPDSALRILAVLAGNDLLESASAIPRITLVLPWSTVPGGTGQTVSEDATDAAALSLALGSASDQVLIIWGTVSQAGMPDIRTPASLFETQVPAAYPYLGAILRECLVSVSGNPGKPILTTGRGSAFSGFQARASSDPLPNLTPSGLPSLQDLVVLQGSGLIPLTRVLGGSFGVHGPLIQLSGKILQNKTAIGVLCSLARQVLADFIGSPNTEGTRARIQNTLDSLSDTVINSGIPVIGMIAELTLELVYNEALQISTFSQINIQGRIRLFSELDSVNFQTRLQS